MLRLGRLLTAPRTTLVFILFYAVDLNELAIVVHPDNQCATVGETVQFNCSTDKRSEHAIEWKHRRSSHLDEEMDFVYSDGKIRGYYGDTMRYNVNVPNGNGAYNLIINNVTSNDTGEFRCIEKGSQTDYKVALLIVKSSVGKEPSKSEVIHNSNSYGKEDAILGVTIIILVLVIGIFFFIFFVYRSLLQETSTNL